MMFSSSWWLNQPIWKRFVKMGASPPIFGVKIKNIWVATNQSFLSKKSKIQKRTKALSLNLSGHSWNWCTSLRLKGGVFAVTVSDPMDSHETGFLWRMENLTVGRRWWTKSLVVKVIATCFFFKVSWCFMHSQVHFGCLFLKERCIAEVLFRYSLWNQLRNNFFLW